MIVWLNGSFGVGKTSVARELLGLIPNARISDPERIGFVVRRTFWRNLDYQEVPLWRRLTRWSVKRAGRRGTAIVPMTVTRRDVLDEVVPQGARVFVLTASRSTLQHRIAGSSEARAWRMANLERCHEAFQQPDTGITIDTEGRTPLEIARSILDLI